MEIQGKPLVHKEQEGINVARIDYSNGILLYLEGHKFPYKGRPTEEAVNAINIAKVFIKDALRFRNLLTPRKTYRELPKNLVKILGPHFLKEEFQTNFTREFTKLLLNLGINKQLSNIIAHIFEYDSAYRCRIQDLFSETDKFSLIDHPFLEIHRLLGVNKERELKNNGEVHKKIRKFTTILLIALLYPPFRRRYKDAINKSNFINLQLDSIDEYWLKLRTDYGRPHNQLDG